MQVVPQPSLCLLCRRDVYHIHIVDWLDFLSRLRNCSLRFTRPVFCSLITFLAQSSFLITSRVRAVSLPIFLAQAVPSITFLAQACSLFFQTTYFSDHFSRTCCISRHYSRTSKSSLRFLITSRHLSAATNRVACLFAGRYWDYNPFHHFRGCHLFDITTLNATVN